MVIATVTKNSVTMNNTASVMNTTAQYPWAGRPAEKMARIVHFTRVDMTTDVVLFPGGDDLGSKDNGRVLEHTRALIQSVRNISHTDVGRVAIALMEDMMDVAVLVKSIRE
jgi:hypothetical protein